MIVVDGSRGGGQLVRAAVTFAALTGNAVRVVDARTAREQPGLKAQHVAAIDAATHICDAAVDGAEIGSTTFEFDPGQPTGGTYSIDIGTAGSIVLVFDTILPLGTTLDDAVELTVTGGTDVEWAPTLDYYRHVKLALLRRFGLEATVTVERRGFYPAGGGRATLRLAPSRPSAIQCVHRGELDHVQIHSTASSTLENASVADRQATAAVQHLPDDVAVQKTVQYVEGRSPGSVLDVVAVFEGSRAGFSVLGRRGKPAEDVGTEAVAALSEFRTTDAAVDRYLADQLLPFLALSGGRVRAPSVTNHVETQTALLRQFGYDVTVDTNEGVLLSGSGDRRTDRLDAGGPDV